MTGPAHAVYFGTYEIVKEMAGGNVDDGHHPLAAGNEMDHNWGATRSAWLTLSSSSYEWSLRDNRQRCADEPIRW